MKFVGKNYSNVYVSFIIACLIFTLTSDIFFTIPLFETVENKILDLQFTRRGQLKPVDSLDVIILGISKETLEEIPEPYNRWPIPRYFFARVIENLNRAGVKAIGIDILFSEKDRYSEINDSLVLMQVKKYKNVVFAGKMEEADWRFQTIARDMNFESIYFKFDSSLGIVNVLPDDDGVLRKYIPFYHHDGLNINIPAFSLGVINKVIGLSNLTVPQVTSSSFILGEIEIPKFTKNSILINYYGESNTFPVINFIDVLDDRYFKTKTEIETGIDINTFDDEDFGLISSGVFRDKIVLIGSIEPEDKDLFPVPIEKKKGDTKGLTGNLMFGVEIHANVIQMILDKNFLSRQNKIIEFLLIILITLISINFFNLLRKIKFKYGFISEVFGAIVSLILLLALYEISFLYFEKFNLVFYYLGLGLAILAGYFISTTENYLRERKQKIMIKNMFSQYVNPELVNELIDNPDKLRLGGERKDMTVMFTDLANFTTFSEQIEPELLVQHLNEFFDAMTEIILLQKGTLDKFEGDAIMAFWGAPLDDPNHAENAVYSAILMKDRMKDFYFKWQSELGYKIKMRIGINSGIMLVGNMGGRKKFDYTVMGDNVNLASRLEAINKIYGTEIIISENTYTKVEDKFICRELDYIIVKGKTKPVRIYELIDTSDWILTNDLSLRSAIQKKIEYFERGLSLYRNRLFSDAIREFEKVLKIDSEDLPAQIFIDRCFEYINHPPAEDWSGAYESKIK